MAKTQNTKGFAFHGYSFLESTNGSIQDTPEICHVFYPSGKPRIPHFLCLSCRGRIVKGSQQFTTASPLTPWI